MAAFEQSSIFRSVLLKTNINTAAFCPAGCRTVECFILEVFPVSPSPPLFKMSLALSPLG